MGVESIEWEGKGNSVANNNILDNDPNWPSSLTPVSKRVFPGARLADVNASLDKVNVKVRLTTEPVMPFKLYLKSFDVDDPTADNNVVDDESTADDNRGLTPNQAGQLTGADANGILTLNISKQEHTAEFQTTMQPGDNYRIAASFDKNYLMQLINDDTQGSTNMEKQLIVDGKQNHSNLFMSRISDSHQYVSAPLTVWRFLHIERDSMGVITKNSISGNITNVITQGIKSAVLTDITFTEINSSNRFRHGTLHNNGQIFKVDVHIDGSNLLLQVFNNNAVIPAIGPVTIYDDDDFNNDDIHKKDGDENK